MFHGKFVHEARASEANLTEIGRHMAGTNNKALMADLSTLHPSYSGDPP